MRRKVKSPLRRFWTAPNIILFILTLLTRSKIMILLVSSPAHLKSKVLGLWWKVENLRTLVVLIVICLLKEILLSKLVALLFDRGEDGLDLLRTACLRSRLVVVVVVLADREDKIDILNFLSSVGEVGADEEWNMFDSLFLKPFNENVDDVLD